MAAAGPAEVFTVLAVQPGQASMIFSIVVWGRWKLCFMHNLQIQTILFRTFFTDNVILLVSRTSSRTHFKENV